MTRTETPQTPAPGVKRKLYSQHEQWPDRLHSCNQILTTRVLQNYFSKCPFCKEQKQNYLPCFIKHLLYVCSIFSSTSFTQAKSKGKTGQWAGQTRINCRSYKSNGRNVKHHRGWDNKASLLRQWVSEFCHPAECPGALFLQGSCGLLPIWSNPPSPCSDPDSHGAFHR